MRPRKFMAPASAKPFRFYGWTAEFDIHVRPWFDYSEHGEPWLHLNVRHKSGRHGAGSFWLSWNGHRLAEGRESVRANRQHPGILEWTSDRMRQVFRRD